MPDENPADDRPSTFASRRADREAREQVEGPAPEPVPKTFRVDASAVSTPSLVINRVRA